MIGLQNLRVETRVAFVWQRDWSEYEIKILQPVRAVTTPRNFELVLCWPAGSDESSLSTLPCRISRSLNPESSRYLYHAVAAEGGRCDEATEIVYEEGEGGECRP